MTERNLTISDIAKIVVSTVLVIVGFFVVWGMAFILCFALTLNSGLSLLLGFLPSALAVFPLMVILTLHRKRTSTLMSKRQKIGIWIAWAMLFTSAFLWMVANPSAIQRYLPTLTLVTFIVFYGTLRREKETVQK